MQKWIIAKFSTSAGAAILQALTPAGFKLGATSLAADVTPLMGFFIEASIAFVLVLTVFGATDGNRLDVLGSVPLAIGLSITVCHLFAVRLQRILVTPTITHVIEYLRNRERLHFHSDILKSVLNDGNASHWRLALSSQQLRPIVA